MESPICEAPWCRLPDTILLHTFSYLKFDSLLAAACVCHSWLRVAYDDFLWKDVFYRHYAISRTITMAPRKLSWREEFKRLYFHTPTVEIETIQQHTDQVLHVSFSHSGEMFATSSKDGHIKVLKMQFILLQCWKYYDSHSIIM